MGRGLFSGIVWGSVFSVLVLWVAAQMGGVIELLAGPPAQVADTAPVEVTKLDDVTEPAPKAPAPDEEPETNPSRQTTGLGESESSDAAPAAETITAAAPDADTSGATQPEVEASPATEPVASTASDPATSTSTVNSGSAPAEPSTDQAPQVATINKRPTAPQTLGAEPTAPGEAATPEAARPATDQQPVVSADPAPPSQPGVENLPVVDFSQPQIVLPEPTPQPEAESAPEPVPATGAEPAVEPEPEPAIEPEPEPTPAPAPVPEAPQPAPQTEIAALPDVSPEQESPVSPAATESDGTAAASPASVEQPKGDAPAEPDTAPAEPEVATPAPKAETPAAVDEGAEDKPATDFSNLAPNVKINRLPTIGGDRDAVEETVEEAPEPAAEGPAIARFAVPFENPDGRPLMAIVLLDQPDSPDTPAQALPFPVSYAVDASRDDAADRMRRYREGGSEVLAITPLPEGARPQDAEVAFQTYLAAVDEAVAVMDTPEARFQSGRILATQIAEAMAATGHGIVTYSRGMNSATQIAEREGVPAAIVFREFDKAGQNKAAIKRFLDQAAFRAGQQPGVILVGHNRPETIVALTEWGLGNRAATVALAPVSAALQAK